jgi:integrase/recombinase XerD
MRSLAAALDEYLVLRRVLGHKLEWAGSLLRQFVAFADEAGADYITTEVTLAWATRRPTKSSPEWTRRLGLVRHFAQYCSAHDPRTVVPPQDLLFGRYQRPTPYIYRDDEISRLLNAAAKLPSKTGLRPYTFTTLFGLYAVTGLRCQEPLQLDRHDVDWRNDVLTIRGAKFGKSRLVPLHPTTVEALRAYAALRDRLCRDPESPSFFLSDRGVRLTHWAVRATFITLSHRIGLRSPGDSHGPRLHDLRHRMAVNTLLRWYREGIDVERRLPALSTYLGHAHITDTYWYLTATPELLQRAMLRVEQPISGALP